MTRATLEKLEAWKRRAQQAELRRLASLARLALGPAERARFRELADLLG